MGRPCIQLIIELKVQSVALRTLQRYQRISELNIRGLNILPIAVADPASIAAQLKLAQACDADSVVSPQQQSTSGVGS